MKHRIALLPATIVLCAGWLTAACMKSDDYRTRQATQYAAIRQALIGDIRGQIGWNLERMRARESEMLFEVEESRAVRDLTYHWALHAVPTPHASVGVRAVVAARLREYRVVESPSDWWSVMGVWRPDSETAAGDACLELLRLLRRDWPDDDITFLAQRWSFRRLTNRSDAERVLATADDSVHIEAPTPGDPTWRTTAWFVGFRGRLIAARYRCTIPAGHEGDGVPELVLLDSIIAPRSGLVP